MINWFEPRRWLTGSSRPIRSSKRRPPARKLFLEKLEDLNLLSTLDVTAGSLTYAAADGIDNNLTIALVGGNPATSYSFNDTAETITLSTNAKLAGWTGDGTNTVTGPISSVSVNFTVNLLTGADALNVDGNISVSNQVLLQSGQNTAFNGTGGIATPGNVSLTANTGSISQSGTGSLAGTMLFVLASTGIGTSNTSLATAVGNLAAQTGTGGIFIANAPAASAPLNITDNSAGLAGVQVTGASGDISLTNTGSIDVTTDGDVIRGPGNVTVMALGNASDVVTGGQVNSGLAAIGVTAATTGNVLVKAGRDIGVGGSGSAGSVSAESGAVTLVSVRDLRIDNGSNIGCAPSSSIFGAGMVTLQAGQNVSVDHGSSAGNAGPHTITDKGLLATAARNITVDHGSALGNAFATATSANNIIVTAGGNVVVNNQSFLGDRSNSTLSVTATNGSISAMNASFFHTAGGAINLSTAAGGTFTLSQGSQVSSVGPVSGGTIIISADDMVLDSASSSNITASGGGTVRLQQASTAARSIDLGGGASAGALNLSDSELGVVTAGVLQIGRSGNPGNIAVTAPVLIHAGFSTLSLFTGGGITQASGASIAVSNLAVRSVNSVVLTQGNIGQALAASVTGSGQNFTFTQGVATPLTVGNVDGLVGIADAAGSISLSGPALNLAANVTSGTNQTYTGPVTLAANVALASSNNGNIVFTSTVQSPATPFSLSVNTGGVTTFSGAVGGSGNPLGGLTTGATGSTQINGGSVNSSAQTYGNTVTFGTMPATLTGNVAFNGKLILGNTATTATGTLQVTGNLIFSKTTTLTSTFAGTATSQFGHVVVSGATTFTGATLSLNYKNFTPATQNAFDMVGNGVTPNGQFVNAPSPGPVTLNGTPFAVSYSGGASGKDFVLTTDALPVFTSPSSFVFTINSPGTFTVTATGVPAPTLKQTGTLPKGVTFTATTGVISGTPTAFGSFPLTITATNAVGTTTQNFTLIVSGIPSNATTPNQRFISQVYVDLLGRVVDSGGLTAWTNQLTLGVARSQVVLQIETSPSNEFRTVEVQQIYQRYLNRNADPTGLANSVALLANGGTVQQLATILASSNEFFKNAGSTNTGFLQALYQAALQRPIDPAALAFDSLGLANGSFTRGQLAQFVITSMEANQDLVEIVYMDFLHRAADPSGLAFNMQSLANGATFEQLVAFVVGSTEFFQNDVGP